MKNEIRDSYWLLDVLSPISESTVKDLDKKELCDSSNRLEGKSKYQFHKPSNTKISSTLLGKGGGYHLSYVLLFFEFSGKKSKKKGGKVLPVNTKLNLN